MEELRPGMSQYDVDQLKPLLDKDGNWKYNEHNILIMEDGLPYEIYIPPKPNLSQVCIQKLRPAMSIERYEKLQPLLDDKGNVSWDINGLIILEDGLPCMRPEDRDKNLLPRIEVDSMKGVTLDPVISDEMAGKLAKAFIASQKKEEDDKADEDIESKFDENGLLRIKDDTFCTENFDKSRACTKEEIEALMDVDTSVRKKPAIKNLYAKDFNSTDISWNSLNELFLDNLGNVFNYMSSWEKYYGHEKEFEVNILGKTNLEESVFYISQNINQYKNALEMYIFLTLLLK
jgi:hypothetical protein